MEPGPAGAARQLRRTRACGDVAQGGWCVAREPGGRVVLVRHALPGERVLARVTEVTARFARAEATEILEPSPDRVEPPCPHARPGGCGGCDWQHASLAAQRRLKAAVIGQQLRRIAGLDRAVTVEPLPGDADGLGWRTRVRFAVRADGLAGLRQHRSHDDRGRRDLPDRAPAGQRGGITGDRWPGAESVAAVTSPGTERARRRGDPGAGAAPPQAGRPGRRRPRARRPAPERACARGPGGRERAAGGVRSLGRAGGRGRCWWPGDAAG